MDGLVDRVRALLIGVVGPRRIPAAAGPDTPLGEDGFWLDSIDLHTLVVACEEEFEIALDAADLTPDALRTVASLAALVRRKTEAL